jgi:hypothetical protein
MGLAVLSVVLLAVYESRRQAGAAEHGEVISRDNKRSRKKTPQKELYNTRGAVDYINGTAFPPEN